MRDHFTVQLDQYERRLSKADEAWERALKAISDNYGDIFDEMIGYINSVADDTGFEPSDLWKALADDYLPKGW